MFKNKNIIITGGSSGIGESLAQRLFEEGANLALIARDRKKLLRVKKSIFKKNTDAQSSVEIFPCDITSAAKTKQTISAIAKKMGPPDILINSAGIIQAGYFENLATKNFREIMETNFFGTLHVIRAALPYLKKQKKSRIVIISSIAGMVGVFGYSSYCASKFALTGLSDSLRAELKPQGIKVQLIMPPEITTPMIKNVNKHRSVENKALGKKIKALTAEQAAYAIIKGIRSGRYRIIFNLKARILMKIGQISPLVGRIIIDFTIKRKYRGPGKGKMEI